MMMVLLLLASLDVSVFFVSLSAQLVLYVILSDVAVPSSLL
jgi:hypothetical protein